MKTLVFFGSARKNGHTKEILDRLSEELGGEIEVIDAYRTTDITSCVDCRLCWKKRECSLKDEMQEIYKKIDEADNIIIASPVYFHNITGELKRIIDRCQVYWAAHVRGDKPNEPTKKGAYILVGGAPRFMGQFYSSEVVCEGVLGDLDAKVVGKIEFDSSDFGKYSENEETIAQIKRVARLLKED